MIVTRGVFRSNFGHGFDHVLFFGLGILDHDFGRGQRCGGERKVDRCRVIARRSNATPFQLCPQGSHRGLGVTVEVAAADSEKLPPRSFEVTLSRHVGLISFWTVPAVAIAFDREPSIDPFDDQIDPISIRLGIADRHLGQDAIASSGDPVVDVPFELGIKHGIADIGHGSCGTLHVREKAMPEAVGVQIIRRHGMKEPELVLGPTDRDIESLDVGLGGQCGDANRPGRRHHAQEDDVSLVTLERVGVAADQASPMELGGVNGLEQDLFDALRLGRTGQADDAHGKPLVSRVGEAPLDLGDDRLGLHGIFSIGGVALSVTVFDVADHQRVEAVGWEVAQGVEWRAAGGVAEIVRELNDFRHATEVLAQADFLVESDLGVLIEAALRLQQRTMRKTFGKLLSQAGDHVIANTDARRTDLLIVSHDDLFLGEIQQEETLDAQLARFVRDDHVEALRGHIDHFRHQVPRHDPDGYGNAALLHVFTSLSTQSRDAFGFSGSLADLLGDLPPCLQGLPLLGGESLEEVTPCLCRGNLGDEVSDSSRDLLAFGEKRHDATPRYAAFKAVHRHSPRPGVFEFGEPWCPCVVLERCRDQREEAWERCLEAALQIGAALVGVPDVVGGHEFISNLRVGARVALIDRITEFAERRMGGWREFRGFKDLRQVEEERCRFLRTSARLDRADRVSKFIQCLDGPGRYLNGGTKTSKKIGQCARGTGERREVVDAGAPVASLRLQETPVRTAFEGLDRRPEFMEIFESEIYTRTCGSEVTVFRAGDRASIDRDVAAEVGDGLQLGRREEAEGLPLLARAQGSRGDEGIHLDFPEGVAVRMVQFVVTGQVALRLEDL